jgi:hypothetical protein
MKLARFAIHFDVARAVAQPATPLAVIGCAGALA